MNTWTPEEEKRLRALHISPARTGPKKLADLVRHFSENGTLYAVTELGDLHVSKDLGKKVRSLTKRRKLDWVLADYFGAHDEYLAEPGGPDSSVISGRLISDIRKIAKAVENKIYVPTPDTPLLTFQVDEGRKVEEAVVDEAMGGQALPLGQLTVAAGRTPWWRSDAPPEVTLSLNAEHNALFARFIELRRSRALQAALDRWGRMTEEYLALVQSSAHSDEIEEAFSKAGKAADEAHTELWAAVETFRWSSETP